jgi:glycosyltransferase involved in cell wall biosynthesis
MAKRLRIAQVAPAAEAVTPTSTGSIEQLVWLMTEELVRRGHEVTLFATGSSETSAALHAVYPRGYEEDEDLWNYEFHETLHVAAAFERARAFDVIHSHVYHSALPFARLVRTPTIHSYHVLPDADIVHAYARYPEARVVALSSYQRGVFTGNADVAVVPHGIRTDAFPFNPARGDYLVFLGRIMPGKGTAEAAQLARQAGMRLVIAGPRSEYDEGYFESEVAPWIDGRQVEYIGPVSVKERDPLLAGAAALLYPITEPEPFGLVLIEAMACGTPVAALGLGAVPEIVSNGVTGYHTATVEELAARIPDVIRLDRHRVRQTAVERFDYRRMVDDYEAVYRRLAKGRRRPYARTPARSHP